MAKIKSNIPFKNCLIMSYKLHKLISAFQKIIIQNFIPLMGRKKRQFICCHYGKIKSNRI